MGQGFAGVCRRRARVTHVAMFNRRLKVRDSLGDMRVVIAGILGLGVDQRFFGVMGDAVSVASLTMGDGFLRMRDRLPEVIIGIAEDRVDSVADRVFGPCDLRRRKPKDCGG